jgi:deoxyribose-phosphate aldolase
VNSTLLADNSEASLKKFLNKLSAVDEVGAKARVEMLATRSIKTASKNWAIDKVI